MQPAVPEMTNPSSSADSARRRLPAATYVACQWKPSTSACPTAGASVPAATRPRSTTQLVTRVVTDQLGLALNVGTDFTLVDDQHLQRLAAEASLAPHDGPGKVVGLFTRKGRRRVMYVLSGLPQILLIQTIAHEWAHAWQGENCPLLENTLVREGFAEWTAYKTLQTMGATHKMALMKRQDGLYGQGLQRMLELEQRNGPSGVIAFCRQAE
jgi:hypothetical protein